MGISQSSRIIQMIGQVIDEPLQTSSHKPQPQKLNQTKKLQQKLAFNGLENREYLKNTCIRKGKKNNTCCRTMQQNYQDTVGTRKERWRRDKELGTMLQWIWFYDPRSLSSQPVRLMQFIFKSICY